MKERITKLQQQWEYLVQKSNEKSQHLKESNQQQQFNTNVKELDFWLGEVRTPHKYVFEIVIFSRFATWTRQKSAFLLCILDIRLH